DVPVEKQVPLLLVELAVARIEIAGHERQRIAAAEDAVMIEAEPGGDEVKHAVDPLLGAFQALLKRWRVDALERREQSLARQYCIYASEQQFLPEREFCASPFGEALLHFAARLGPTSADLGEREIAFGQLGAAAVDPVENVDHHVERLVLAGD